MFFWKSVTKYFWTESSRLLGVFECDEDKEMQERKKEQGAVS